MGLDSVQVQVQRILSLANDSTASVQDAQEVFQALFPLATEAVAPDEFQKMLSPALLGSNLPVAGFVGVACGALVENGSDARINVQVILDRLQAALSGSVAFVQACVDRQEAEDAPSQNDEDEESSAVELYGEETAKLHPAWASAFEALHWWGLCGKTFMCAVPEERAAFRDRPNVLAQVALLQNEQQEWGHWLRLLLLAPYREKFLVLHPETQRGYWVEITGVADNFQLHTLLADALIGDVELGWLPGKRPSQAEVEQALIQTEFRDDVVSTGAFNLVNWMGYKSDGSPSGAWIWNEGIPADIALFEGIRVIVLEKPPYSRTWLAQPPFDLLKPELIVLEHLSPVQVQDWLNRFSQALK